MPLFVRTPWTQTAGKILPKDASIDEVSATRIAADANGMELKLEKRRAAGPTPSNDGDQCGVISCYGVDSAGVDKIFAQILGLVNLAATNGRIDLKLRAGLATLSRVLHLLPASLGDAESGVIFRSLASAGVVPFTHRLNTDYNAGQWVHRVEDNDGGGFLHGVDGVGNTFMAGRASALTLLLSGVISPAALAAGETNDYNPAGLATATYLRLTADAAGSLLSGLTAPAAGERTHVVIVNLSAVATLTLEHADASSAAANQFSCPGGADVVLPALGSAVLWYDTVSSLWRPLS